MICKHKDLSVKNTKILKKEIIDCHSDNCNYHVEKMLPSVFVMGLYYIFSGLILSVICILPIFYFHNFYLKTLIGLPMLIFGLWGFNVSGAGLYICALCFFDQYIITDLSGKRYKYITMKSNTLNSIASHKMEIN